MSTKWPSMAAAAAIWGDTRWVRPPRPWRPSKLRLEVEAQRWPGWRMSGFIPRHIERPAGRQPNPAGRRSAPAPEAPRGAEHLVPPLLLGLRAPLLGPGHHHRPDVGRHLAALDDLRGGP